MTYISLNWNDSIEKDGNTWLYKSTSGTKPFKPINPYIEKDEEKESEDEIEKIERLIEKEKKKRKNAADQLWSYYTLYIKSIFFADKIRVNKEYIEWLKKIESQPMDTKTIINTLEDLEFKTDSCYKCYDYDIFEEKIMNLDVEEWKKVKHVAEFTKTYEKDFILYKKKQKLCQLTDCYKLNKKAYCSECGHQNPKGAKFCSQCGNKL